MAKDDYNKSLHIIFKSVMKTIERKVKNQEALNELDLLWYVYFSEIAPCVADYQKSKQKEKKN